MDPLNRIDAPPTWALTGLLGTLLQRLSRDFEARILRKCHARGHLKVRNVHAALIGHIRDGQLRLNELALRAGISQQATGKLVRELERVGYVECRVLPDDRRARCISLTVRGQQLLEDFDAVLAEVRGDYISAVGPTALVALEHQLHLAAAALENLREA